MIRSINYVPEEAKKQAETQALGALMNKFTDEMAGKLMSGVAEGKTGWDDPDGFEKLQAQLLENLKLADWVDVACLAMLIWNLGQK